MPKGVKGFQKGHIFGKRFKKGHKPWSFGKNQSDETKQKISKSLKGKPQPWNKNNSNLFKKGHKLNNGKNHPQWKGGISYGENRKNYYRRKVLERIARKNGAIGSHTYGEWELLKAQYNWTCPCCGRKEPEIKLTEDHIIPLSKGGSDNIENIQPLCLSCNSKKNNKIIKYESK